MEWLIVLLLLTLCGVLLLGFPVAFSLAGVGLIFILVGTQTGLIDEIHLRTIPNRLFGIFNNRTLIAVPMFVFMGLVLERSGLAEDLLDALAGLTARMKGGLGIAVILVGGLLAASTGIVGATVVTLGVLALPSMLQRGWSPSAASGIIAATGTLGQIIPPSIVLILLGDVISNANQQAQLSLGKFSAATLSVGELFMGALLPGLALVALYLLYVSVRARLQPEMMPASTEEVRPNLRKLAFNLSPPLLLIVSVLGSIASGIATPTEASGVGAAGAIFIALARRKLNWPTMRDASLGTIRITTMVFAILIGASLFSLVFRELGGDDVIQNLFSSLPGGAFTAVLLLMALVFFLGFILDFIEITYIVLPLVGPAVLALGVDPVWLGIMLAINLQTSFLTPPFGFAIFYLRGVAPQAVQTHHLYSGVLPFVLIQLGMLALLAIFPAMATWLPEQIYG